VAQLDPLPLHEIGQLDFEAWCASLEDEFARASRVRRPTRARIGALLVHVRTRQTPARRSRRPRRAEGALRTAGVTVLDVIVQRRVQLDPRYVVGGEVDEIGPARQQLGAELLIFDPDLTPGQARAVTQVTELKVVDRTMLILDIFAQRRRSRDGKVAVELAQLNYTLPRLAEKNTMMSRSRGHRRPGPGETKLENQPAPGARAHPAARAADRAAVAPARAAAVAAPPPGHAGGEHHRLHERGQSTR